ncbi:MAG: alpha/beta hydrolase [Proteobacteria bacterium]|jgi:alpha/beta superfamily hydrolase|nr:alpha/beta hydrolase [Pseudomonadota bacterium]
MNPRIPERTLIEGAAGAIETVVAVPQGPLRGIALVTHPHPLQGGTLDNKVTVTLARTFLALGYAAVRFNFRGVGASAGAFDEGVGETEDALTVLARVRARFGEELPVALAGFSFGSFVQTRVAQRVVPEGLVLVGAAVKRFALAPVPKNTIVIHGEMDDVVLLADVLDWARPQQLPIVVFPGCGHFFHGRIVQLAEVVTRMWPPRG